MMAHLSLMEAIMPEQSTMHFYLNWAKERIDEMDATLASLEARAREMRAESKVKADQLVDQLSQQRDAFKATVRKQADAGEAIWARTRGDLEKQWGDFEAQVKTYFETVGKQIEQQQATFKDVAAAQMKAWREAAEKFNEAAGKVVAERRVDFDAALKRMQSDASEYETRFQKMKAAGSESWLALSGALAESRKAFDHANKAAWDALKGSASHNS
jgi:hypothetical protein